MNNNSYNNIVYIISEIQSKQDYIPIIYKSYNTDFYNEIEPNDDNKCIICWNENGTIKLCVNCKLLYCLHCAIKVNKKCTICNRYTNKYNNYDNYDNYDIDIQLPLSITLFLNIFMSLILFTTLLFFGGLICYILYNFALFFTKNI